MTDERIEWRLRHDAVPEERWAAGTVARAIAARRSGREPFAPAVRRVGVTPTTARLLPSFGTLLAVLVLVGSVLVVRNWSVAGPSQTPAASATPAPSPTPNTALERIRAAGVIRIAVIGPVDGVHGEVAQAVADELGVRAELTSVPEAEVKTLDWGDRYDAAAGVIRSFTLREKVLFTPSAYGYRPAWLVVAADSPHASLVELEGHTVCVRPGGEPENWLSGAYNIDPAPAEVETFAPELITRVTDTTDEGCLAQVASGAADATFVDTLDPEVLADRRYRTVGDPVFVEQMTLAVPILKPEAAGLLQPFDDLLTHGLWVDGTLPSILAGATDGTTGDTPGASPRPS